MYAKPILINIREEMCGASSSSYDASTFQHIDSAKQRKPHSTRREERLCDKTYKETRRNAIKLKFTLGRTIRCSSVVQGGVLHEELTNCKFDSFQQMLNDGWEAN